MIPTIKVRESANTLKWRKIFQKCNALNLSRLEVWDCKTLDELQALVDVAYKAIVARHHPDRPPKPDSKFKPWKPGMSIPVRYEYEPDVWLSIPEAARKFGLPVDTLKSRLKRGQTLYEAVHAKRGEIVFRSAQDHRLLRKAHEARKFFRDLEGLPPKSTEEPGFTISDSLPLNMERW